MYPYHKIKVLWFSDVGLFFFFLIYTTHAHRLWFTFYHYRHGQVVADNGWKVLLLLGRPKRPRYSVTGPSPQTAKITSGQRNTSKHSTEENKYHSHWTIKYQDTVGDQLWMSKVLWFPVLLLMFAITFSCLLVKFMFNDEHTAWLVYAICFAIEGIIIIIFSVFFGILTISGVSRFTDLLQIKKELIYLLWGAFVFFITTSGWFLVIFIINGSIGATPQRKIFVFGIISLLSFFSHVVMISWVLYQYDNRVLKLSNCVFCDCKLMKSINYDLAMDRNRNRNRQLRSIIDTRTFSNASANTYTFDRQSTTKTGTGTNNTTNNLNDHTTTLSISTVIGHEVGFGLFMRHLVDEYAVENLLFCTEVIQFKNKSPIFLNIDNLFIKQQKQQLEKQNKEKNKAKEQEQASDPRMETLNVVSTQFSPIEIVGSVSSTPRGGNINTTSLRLEIGSSSSLSRSVGGVESKMVQTKKRRDYNTQFPVLPDNIPLSNIMKEKNIFNKIRMIVDRYIIDSAHLQVNISSFNRYGLYKKMDVLQQWQIDCKDSNENVNDEMLIQLYQFFDDSCKEILHLLQSSFRNFKLTEAYMQFQSQVLEE